MNLGVAAGRSYRPPALVGGGDGLLDASGARRPVDQVEWLGEVDQVEAEKATAGDEGEDGTHGSTGAKRSTYRASRATSGLIARNR